MTLEKAKIDREKKKAFLANDVKNFFNDPITKNKIDVLIGELSDENIENKITDFSKDITTNAEQHGNRYLIAARIAE
jgi:hypothetical protein